MADTEGDHSIDQEPHLQGRPFVPDPLEEKSARVLSGERALGDPDEERAAHSVFDEPAVLPNRPPMLIDRDWNCRNCGYNLRGLMTGHRCPECGKIERYEPPREGEFTYEQWVSEHSGKISLSKSWLLAILLPIAAIPLAVLPALVTVELAMFFNFVVIGPAMAEVLKIALPSIVLERWSFWIPRKSQLYFMTVGTALVFSIAGNLTFLLLFARSSPPMLIAYRWSICVLLQVTCTTIATRGLAVVWEQAQSGQRVPSVTRAYPWVTTAIVVHGAYNACVFFRGDFGYGF